MKSEQDTLQWRYATKLFDSNAIIPEPTWQDLEAAMRFAPSSLGLQLWKFLVIDTPTLRAQLREASFGQPQVEDCSHFVVLCARRDVDEQDLTDYVNLQKEIRKIDEASAQAALAKYRNYSFFWADAATTKCYTESQIHLAAGFLTHAAAKMEVDTCIIGGMNPSRYDEILCLTETRYRAVLGMAFGYRSEQDRHANDAKVRYDATRVIEHR